MKNMRTRHGSGETMPRLASIPLTPHRVIKEKVAMKTLYRNGIRRITRS